MHHTRYVVLRQERGWNIVRGGRRYPDAYPEKTQAVCVAVDFAREDGRAGRAAEVLVRHEDGRYLKEWTPGCDLTTDKMGRPARH